uniref:acid phosphatase n=1 Tax=Ciona savignyi TaxID=51511 RepID=H2ZIM7_CIOSA
MEDLVKELTVSLGTQEKNPYYIVDNLVTLNDLGFPHLLDEETWQRLQSWKFKIYSLCILGKLGKRHEVLPILCGPLIDDILHQLEQPIKTSANMFYYSGHDATILRFLTALGVEIETVPPTSSTVVLEIHELENGIHAKVLYNWQEQIIRGAATSLVPFQHLVEVLSPFRMSLETFKQIQRNEFRNE